jgi:hypothetical protein
MVRPGSLRLSLVVGLGNCTGSGGDLPMWIARRLSALSTTLLGLMIGVGGSSEAGISLYEDESAYLAATTGLTTVDFNGIAPANGFISYGNGPLTLQGTTFTSNDELFIIDPGFYSAPYPQGGFLSGDFSNPNIINVALPGAFTALGMNYGALFGRVGSVTFNFLLSDGSSFVATTSASITEGSLDFVGITSTVGIVSVEITAPDSPAFNAIDNLNFGSAAVPPAVPEPSSFGLCGITVVAGLGYARTRRRPA